VSSVVRSTGRCSQQVSLKCWFKDPQAVQHVCQPGYFAWHFPAFPPAIARFEEASPTPRIGRDVAAEPHVCWSLLPSVHHHELRSTFVAGAKRCCPVDFPCCFSGTNRSTKRSPIDFPKHGTKVTCNIKPRCSATHLQHQAQQHQQCCMLLLMKKHQCEMMSKARSKRTKQQHWWLLPRSPKSPKLLRKTKATKTTKASEATSFWARREQQQARRLCMWRLMAADHHEDHPKNVSVFSDFFSRECLRHAQMIAFDCGTSFWRATIDGRPTRSSLGMVVMFLDPHDISDLL
jgi:hypothetical protein